MRSLSPQITHSYRKVLSEPESKECQRKQVYVIPLVNEWWSIMKMYWLILPTPQLRKSHMDTTYVHRHSIDWAPQMMSRLSYFSTIWFGQGTEHRSTRKGCLLVHILKLEKGLYVNTYGQLFDNEWWRNNLSGVFETIGGELQICVTPYLVILISSKGEYIWYIETWFSILINSITAL